MDVRRIKYGELREAIPFAPKLVGLLFSPFIVAPVTKIMEAALHSGKTDAIESGLRLIDFVQPWPQCEARAEFRAAQFVQ